MTPSLPLALLAVLVSLAAVTPCLSFRLQLKPYFSHTRLSRQRRGSGPNGQFLDLSSPFCRTLGSVYYDCGQHDECVYASKPSTNSSSSSSSSTTSTTTSTSSSSKLPTDRGPYIIRLLDEFNRAFPAKEFKWMLFGGSLLGAMPERGQVFIPGDDDGDLAITWKDFNRLARVVEYRNTRFGTGGMFMFEVECHNPDIPARVVCLRTGLYIDVFVFYEAHEYAAMRKDRRTWCPMCTLDGREGMLFNPPYSGQGEGQQYSGCNLLTPQELEPVACSFSGLHLFCPAGRYRILQGCYGDTWKIPDRGSDFDAQGKAHGTARATDKVDKSEEAVIEQVEKSIVQRLVGDHRHGRA